MSEYGLKIKNANGDVVIDGNYANLALVEKYTLTASGPAAGPNGGARKTSLRLTGYVSPVLVVYSPGTTVSHTGSRSSATTWDYNFQVGAAGVPFEVYCFDIASRGQRFLGNYGLVVKNKTTGEVVFDSRCKYMRILDSYIGQTGFADTDFIPTINRTYNALKVGVCQGLKTVSSVNQVIGVGSPDPDHLVVVVFSAVSSKANTAQITSMQYWVSGPKRLSQNPQVNWKQRGYSYLMVDLSNFD